MSDSGDDGGGTLPSLALLVDRLVATAGRADDAVRIDQIRVLEQVKAVAAALQADVTHRFALSQRAAQVAAGVRSDEVCRGIAAQVGLARRVSPFHAARYVGWAGILVTELPATFAALAAGDTTEARAMIVARETAWLSVEDRAVVDAELAPRLQTWAERRIEAETKKAAYRLDPHGYLARVRGAHSDRHVSLRPAPDTMCRLTAFLPVAQGVAAYAALKRAADTTTAAGDERGRGQIMADTLVELITGQTKAANVPVEVSVIMTDHALFNYANPSGFGAGSDEPAELIGYGPVPAELARRLLGEVDDDTQLWLRRLYTDPKTGQLAAMDSSSRAFTGNQRKFLILRDRVCRTPWCEAPIRHADHVRPAERGGATAIANGQGLCAACNYAKQAPGWHATPATTARGATDHVITVTPTGHRYVSQPPDPPGTVIAA